MRKVLVLVAATFLFWSMASGAPLCSTFAGQDVLNINATGCELGPLLFNNFGVQNAGNVTSPLITLISVAADTGLVTLNFNPNLGNQTLQQDLHFVFQVTALSGGVIGADLFNGGVNSSIQEKNCTTSMDISTGACNGTLLWNVVAFDNQYQPGPGPTNEFVYVQGPQSVVWVWKDINTQAGGHNTAFSETFGIPEPLSFVLMGSGLLGLGLLRRSRKS